MFGRKVLRIGPNELAYELVMSGTVQFSVNNGQPALVDAQDVVCLCDVIKRMEAAGFH